MTPGYVVHIATTVSYWSYARTPAEAEAEAMNYLSDPDRAVEFIPSGRGRVIGSAPLERPEVETVKVRRLRDTNDQ